MKYSLFKNKQGNYIRLSGMIDKFYIQTNDTVLDFMSEIAKSKEVFSTFSGREIDNYTVCFYATKT